MSNESIPKKDLLDHIIDYVRKHPIKIILLGLLYLATLLAWFSVVSFHSAKTAEEVISNGDSLPEGWSAGVMDHGKYYRWWTIREQPVLYGISLIVLIPGTISMAYVTLTLMSLSKRLKACNS